MQKEETQTDGKNFSFSINDEFTLNNLDKIAKVCKMPTGKLARNLVNVGIEEMVLKNNVGLVNFALLLRKVREEFKSVGSLESKDDEKHSKSHKQTMTIWLSTEINEKLDFFTKKLDFQTKSQLVQKLIATGLKEMVISEKIGFLQLLIFSRNAWRKTFSDAEKTIEDGKIDL